MTFDLELATDRQNEIDKHIERENRDREDSIPGLRERLARAVAYNSSLKHRLASLEEEHERMWLALTAENKLLEESRDRAAASLRKQLRRANADKCELERQLGRIRNSVFWKISWPARRVLKKLSDTRENLKDRLSNFKWEACQCYWRAARKMPWIRQVARPILKDLLKIQAPETRLPAPFQAMQGKAFSPLVSVIVPNFSHAPYLKKRLDSIYSQTYANFEAILLDDCSKDDSVSILKDFQKRHPEKTRLAINDGNSGGVFHQWEKGLKLAKGELIWIAESDDFCSENFLETLVPFFHDESVRLAFCRTLFMDATGEKQIWSIDEYLHDIDPDLWQTAFVETAPKIVRKAFAIKNIVPNVSSAVFRNPGPLEILKDPDWKNMRTCGDWVFYLHAIRGGKVAYSSDARNFYRFHGENTSVHSYSRDVYYREHETVAKTLARYYGVSRDTLEKQRLNLMLHWKRNRKDFSRKRFAQCYDLDRVFDGKIQRKPNLMMAGYAFIAGGGEIFPVQLANLMKARGYNVTFLDCAREPRVESVRQRLRKDIPVVSNFAVLKRLVADFEIDIVHSHHAWVDNTVLDLLPENSSCKTVVTMHGMYETIDDSDLKRIFPRLVRRSGKIVYIADNNLAGLGKHGYLKQASPVRVDNALEILPFETFDRKKLDIPESAFLLTLVSRAIPEKGWIEAIDAVTLARKRTGRDIRLVLIGEGPVHDRLREQGAPPFAYLEGFQQNVRGYFAASQMGFLPSRFPGESFPLVVIECLQAGRPVLASAVGQIPCMLETENGPAGDLFQLDEGKIPVEKLAEKIGELAKEKDRFQNALANVRLAAEKFDPRVMANRYEAVYSGVISNRRVN